ncbi:hypothetical protein [Microbacterium sp. NPDC055455]
MSAIDDAINLRTELIARSVKRHRLVFVQLGCMFDPLRDGILASLGVPEASISDRSSWLDLVEASSGIVVVDLEGCVDSDLNVLGEVRETVFSLLDSEKSVCLISRAPRASYRSVPGSSVLEDAALVDLPLLTKEEVPDEEARKLPGWPLPSVTFGNELSAESLRSALAELGSGVLAALDHALFDIDPKSLDGLQFLGSRELEALRGAGLLWMDESSTPRLTPSVSSKLLKESLAEHISATVVPSDQLPVVSNGLWHIERAIRSAVRTAAIEKYGSAWRSSAVGGLKSEILRRAQLDGSVAAKSIGDIRDPLEWLMLGELIDIVRSEKFNHLGVEPAVWRRLQEQLVPIRNRLAHVRMLKSDDHEVVRMWLSVVRDRFKGS